jgi:alpha-tubulin suppressor-like RCC1 family protein
MKKVYFLLMFAIISNIINAQCWQTVSTGQTFTIAIATNGTLWAWGQNNYGQLGDGTLINKSIPTQIGTDNTWTKIATGSTHALAIKNNGTLWGWGAGNYGQQGDNIDSEHNIIIPTQIGTDTNWKEISAGDATTFAIKTNGTLWVCGFGNEGQLGIGITVDKIFILTQIGTSTNWRSIDAGDTHNMAIKTNGTLWSWGANNYGELGLGTITPSELSPMQVGTATDWATVSVGFGYSNLALKTNKTLWACGLNSIGNFGNGNTTNSSIMIQVGTEANWEKISSGSQSSHAIKTNGTLWAWGNNTYSIYGDGTNVDLYIPTQIGTNTDWNIIDTNSFHVNSLKTDNSLYTWGLGNWGNLGQGNNNSYSFPTGVDCTTLGTNDYATNLKTISIYPNPCNDKIFITPHNDSAIQKITITNCNGKEVLLQNNLTNQIDVSSLATGVYCISFYNENSIERKKFIKL